MMIITPPLPSAEADGGARPVHLILLWASSDDPLDANPHVPPPFAKFFELEAVSSSSPSFPKEHNLECC